MKKLILLFVAVTFLQSCKKDEEIKKEDLKQRYTYKVKELEKGVAVIVYSDTPYYNLYDTVWVNMKEQTIDPICKDGTMAVISDDEYINSDL